MLIIFWIFFPNFAGWTFKNIYLKPPSSCSVIIWGTLSKFNSRKRPAPSPSATELPLMHHAIVMFHLMGRHHRCPQHFGHAKYDISTIGVLQSGLSNKKYSIKMLEKGHRIHLQTTFSYIYIYIFLRHSRPIQLLGLGSKPAVGNSIRRYVGFFIRSTTNRLNLTYSTNVVPFQTPNDDILQLTHSIITQIKPSKPTKSESFPFFSNQLNNHNLES